MRAGTGKSIPVPIIYRFRLQMVKDAQFHLFFLIHAGIFHGLSNENGKQNGNEGNNIAVDSYPIILSE